MKKQIYLIIIISFYLLVSCQGVAKTSSTQSESTPANSVTSPPITSPTQSNTPTIIYPLPSPSEISGDTSTPVVKETFIPTTTQITQSSESLTTKCLQISHSFTNDIVSSGIIVLGTKAGGEQRRYDSLILNMDLGEKSEFSTPMKYQVDHAVSSDKKIMAYKSVIFDNNDTLPKYELVIANADGTRLKTINWENKWLDIVEWTIDQRLVLSYDGPYLTTDGQNIPISYMIVDPFTGRQELLQPDVPEFLDLSSSPFLTWRGVIFDPTLNWVIYPRLIDNNNEMYTLVLWDIEKEKLVTSLEDIYQNFVVFGSTTPTPIWSPDGSQFVIRGQIPFTNEGESVLFELYQVSRDGEIEQLTNLTPIELINPERFSWSPDGKYLAILTVTWNTHGDTHLAVLDMSTQVVTDYCIPVRVDQYGDPIYGIPIWSPSGTQLLVMDDTENYRNIILVDIIENFADQIAENYDALGWMVTK